VRADTLERSDDDAEARAVQEIKVGEIKREAVPTLIDPVDQMLTQPGCGGRSDQPIKLWSMAKWEYATVPLLIHATKQILDNWGEDGWELVQVVPGPNPDQLVAYLKREKA
jgi:hypothetical protein